MVFCIALSWLQSRFWINLEKNLTVRQSYSTHMPKRWAPNSHSNQVQLEERIVGRRGKEPGKHPPMFRHILGSHQPLWKCSIPLHLTVTMWKRLAFQTTTENPWTSIRKILECVCYRQKKKILRLWKLSNYLGYQLDCQLDARPHTCYSFLWW